MHTLEVFAGPPIDWGLIVAILGTLLIYAVIKGM